MINLSNNTGALNDGLNYSCSLIIPVYGCYSRLDYLHLPIISLHEILILKKWQFNFEDVWRTGPQKNINQESAPFQTGTAPVTLILR